MKYNLDEFNYVVIWKPKTYIIKKGKAYFALKENAIDLGRYLLRRGYQVKVKQINEPHNS